MFIVMLFMLFDQRTQLNIKSFSRAPIHCYFFKRHVHSRHADIEAMDYYFCSITIAALIYYALPFATLASFSYLSKQGLAH